MQSFPVPRLGIRRKDDSYSEQECDKDSMTIGRDDGNDIVIYDTKASRNHARLERTAKGFFIHDTSRNGTFVNGERVRGSRLLYDRDQIQVADTVIVFQDPAATEATSVVGAPLDPQEELRVDSATKEVYIRGELLEPALTVKEFQLLELLYDKQGQVISKDEIAREVWDYEVFDYNAIDALVYRLRHRIEDNPSSPRYLITQRGFGYRLITTPED